MSNDDSDVGNRREFLLRVAGIALAAGLPLQAQASLFHFPSVRPGYLGPKGDNRFLELCPLSKNCVSTSNSSDAQMYIPPWTYNPPNAKSAKDMETAVKELTEVVQDMKGAKLIESRPLESKLGKGYYIYAEYESDLFGFVDDVEFLFSPDGKTVEYRSQSRVGEDDMKVNRNRIKAIRLALQPKGWQSIGF